MAKYLAIQKIRCEIRRGTWLAVFILGLGLSVCPPISAQISWFTPTSWAEDVAQSPVTIVGTKDGQAVRWVSVSNSSNQFVMQVLNLPFGYNYSSACGVSANGNVIVGYAYDANNQVRAVRWTPDPNNPSQFLMQDIGTLGGSHSAAYDVSADGTVIVGYAYNANNQRRAVRWIPDPNNPSQFLIQDLGTFGGSHTVAYDVSSDGMVIVGYIQYPNSRRAVLWMPDSGVTELLPALGGDFDEAFGISADGTVVVGWSNGKAARWIPDPNNPSQFLIQDLGTLGGINSAAYGVSADGTVVVGWSDTSSDGFRAFRWIEGQGMEDLSQAYQVSNGVLVIASAISQDGRYIVGWGVEDNTSGEAAFLLEICQSHNGDVDESGCVDDADLLAVLFAYGSSGTDLGSVDINCDGTVDDADLLIVLFNYGDGC